MDIYVLWQALSSWVGRSIPWDCVIIIFFKLLISCLNKTPTKDSAPNATEVCKQSINKTRYVLAFSHVFDDIIGNRGNKYTRRTDLVLFIPCHLYVGKVGENSRRKGMRFRVTFTKIKIPHLWISPFLISLSLTLS